MDLNTILSVAVGGLIALIPVLLTNWHQAKEREKDRQEARRQAKMQVMGKLVERDVFAVIDACDNSIRAVRELRGVRDGLIDLGNKFNKGELTDKEKKDRKVTLENKMEDVFSKMRDAHATGIGCLYSFNDEIINAYNAFEKVLIKVQDYYVKQENITEINTL